MTTTAGRRRAEPAKALPGPARTLGLIAGGALVGALGWFLLVRAAIDFGGQAKNGSSVAWVFMTVAAIGAIVCLVLVLVLVNKALTAIGLVKETGVHHGSHSGGHGHRHASGK